MPAKLRIVFMGTPDFAVPALQALHQAGHEIVAVYCQPPKPANRGQIPQKTPVHRAAENLSLEVRTPKTLRDPGAQQELAGFAPDVIVVAAYGLILPQAVLDIPPHGCLNIHGSLLPRWRGAAPIHRALLAGDTETGITIMQMEAGLDTGPMLLKEHVPITPTSTTPELHDKLASMGARLIVEALNHLVSGTLKPEKQSDDGVTYASKLTKEEGAIDWSFPADELELKVRALSPWPGCFFKLGDETIKVLYAEIVKGAMGMPGTLLDDGFTVACGRDALRLTTVQRAGKRPADGASVLRGLRLPLGHVIA